MNNAINKHLRLCHKDWAPDVKKAINDFLDAYGCDSPNYSRDSYAVFDFDNTCSIFDIEEQMTVYQFETMSMEIRPDEMKNMLITGLSDIKRDLTGTGMIKGSFEDLADDITEAYSVLWNRFGPFTYRGVAEDMLEKLHSDSYFLEFAAKIKTMYELMDVVESSDVSYPWIVYWFYGMTEEQIYDVGLRSNAKYSKVETKYVTWNSPAEIKSKAGTVSFTWPHGITVSENIRELWAALHDNGIDVWVCSASCSGAIKSAIDYFGLHEYCSGLLAMNAKFVNNRLINEYDFDFPGYRSVSGGWEIMSRREGAETQGKGKVISIRNAIAPEYSGKGPLAGFMDSVGDFNFCTEFDSLRIVCIFNRADRRVTEGGGVLAAVALYERDTLGYDFKKADEAGDILYLLQGRNELGLRSLRPFNTTETYKSGEKLFRDEHNAAFLKYLSEVKPTITEIINKCAVGDETYSDAIGVKFGFLKKYDGYKSQK